MDYNNIILEINNKISYITINRPNQLNALNSETIKELNHAIIYSEENKNIRCIILTGSGSKAFVAGADIKEFADFNFSQGEELSRKGQELLFDLLVKTISALDALAMFFEIRHTITAFLPLCVNAWVQLDPSK